MVAQFSLLHCVELKEHRFDVTQDFSHFCVLHKSIDKRQISVYIVSLRGVAQLAEHVFPFCAPCPVTWADVRGLPLWMAMLQVRILLSPPMRAGINGLSSNVPPLMITCPQHVSGICAVLCGPDGVGYLSSLKRLGRVPFPTPSTCPHLLVVDNSFERCRTIPP